MSIAAGASAAAEGVASALKGVMIRVSQAAERAGRSKPPRVVAVSKTKPASLIHEAYNTGQRHFGENYVQEIVEKAPQLPSDIQWHFIGHIQSNKAKPLVRGVPNLFVVETVDSRKLAGLLDKACAEAERDPLNVMVQVNTSGEESKSGVEPGQCVDLAEFVDRSCPHLRFFGLMTIGMADYSSRPENFQLLISCREKVCTHLSIPIDDCELSMGMSNDFEQAAEMGSTNVRVGSSIFGARDYSR